MKKLILSLFALAVASVAANAQVSFGPEIGFNLSEYAFTTPIQQSSPNPKYSIRAGGIVDFGLGMHFSIQSGFYYVSNGWNSSDGFGDNQYVNIHTLEVPLNFIVKIGRRSRVWIGGGGYFAYNFSGNVKQSGPNVPTENTSLNIGSDAGSAIEAVDFGYGFSIGWQSKSGLFTRAHFNEGLVNLMPNGDANNSIISATYGTTIGFLFGGRRGPKDYLRYYR